MTLLKTTGRQSKVNADALAHASQGSFALTNDFGTIWRVPANALVIGCVPFACRLRQVTLTVADADMTSDGSNYWTFAVQRFRSTSSHLIVTKGTSVTTMRQQRGMTVAEGNVDFDADSMCWASETIGLTVTATGSPTPLYGFNAIAWFEPIGGEVA